MKALESRIEAINLGKKKYEGSQCKKCNNTLRYVNGHSCVNCMEIKSRSKEKKDYDAKYHINNAEKKKLIAKEWIKNNKDKRKFIIFNYHSKRRELKKNGENSLAIKKWAESQKKICYWCNNNCEKNYHIDHYVPLSKGGKHLINNLVISCPSCNLSKNAKDPYKFAATKGRLF
jgi:5-methylcytosine-specific restriction endonuclease McrA